MKPIQHEKILQTHALAEIIRQHYQRESHGVEITVKFAGFAIDRQVLPAASDRRMSFVAVVQTAPKPDEEGYGSYSDFNSIAPDIPEPTTHSPVKNGSAKQRKNTPPTED